jgi:hypothetical protein
LKRQARREATEAENTMTPGRLLALLLPASAVLALAACGDGTASLRDPRGVLLVVRGAGKESEIYAMRPDVVHAWGIAH